MILQLKMGPNSKRKWHFCTYCTTVTDIVSTCLCAPSVGQEGLHTHKNRLGCSGYYSIHSCWLLADSSWGANKWADAALWMNGWFTQDAWVIICCMWSLLCTKINAHVCIFIAYVSMKLFHLWLRRSWQRQEVTKEWRGGGGEPDRKLALLSAH